MSSTITRRTLLKAALTITSASAFQSRAYAASAELPPDFTLFTSTGPNVLMLKTTGRLVLVDSGAEVGGGLVLDAARKLAPNGSYTLFNTHWHDEQVAGNEALGKIGATIISHEKTRLHLATDVYMPEQERYKPALPAAAQPTQTIYTNGTLNAAGATIDYGHLQSAHTDGDIYVFFRDANVLAVGDVVSPARDPAHDWFGGGWIGGRVDAMDLLLSLADDATVIVPAFGPVVAKAHLQAERDMMQFLYDQLVDQIRLGFTPQDSLDSGVMNNLPRRFNDPYKFLYDAHKGLWAHHNKLAPNIV